MNHTIRPLDRIWPGGPGATYVGQGTKRRVTGVTSRGLDTAEVACGEGGIYTRLEVHRAFIRKVAKEAGVRMS